ncbi:MAG: hypothetical protein VX993_07060 [Candidatus Neomarinimicrobiota bacterium]|nr:hypothetical protein [Candidatus Neomarinimicrobiota bacterium]
MNRIIKLLSIVALSSFVLATENTEETVVEKTTFADDNNTEEISNNVEITPVDIEKMKKVRQAKAEIEKMNAMRFLQKHKNPVPVADANMKAFADRKQAEERIKENKRNGILKTFAETIRKKFPTMRLRSTDGKRAIKFPTNTQTN